MPQSYTSQLVQFTPSGPVTLTAEEAIRMYSIIHAETEAASARWDAETEEAAQIRADSLTETHQTIVSGTAAQTAGRQEVIAPTQVAPHQVVLAPPVPTQVTISQEVAPAPLSATQDDETSSTAT